MDNYESVMIIKPDVTDEEKDNIMQKYENYLKGLSDYEVTVDDLGKKKLAYEVRGSKEGNFAVFKFCAEKENITELERMYRMDDDIIKFIVVRGEPVLEENKFEKEKNELNKSENSKSNSSKETKSNEEKTVKNKPKKQRER